MRPQPAPTAEFQHMLMTAHVAECAGGRPSKCADQRATRSDLAVHCVDSGVAESACCCRDEDERRSDS